MPIVAVVGRVILASGPWIRSLLVLGGAGLTVWSGWGFIVAIRRLGEETAGAVDALPHSVPFEIKPDPNDPNGTVIVPKTGGNSEMIMWALLAAGAIILISRR